ncbi:hypothetical protein DFP72DRAFT_912037 [Ephemerocybe angulata]|uniref:F-box domain-containing protein n=1 Tax=Ephemerocybe angulata TaxID=980116 RepID=A0A8H6HNL9_9AGAR|nr:hypothetical protein DFP72DRAFT_912037 [Tulosesus angulatus]
MSSASKLQQDLDCEIARLEQALIVLKRRRNALSPVSQLPSELLSKIFYLSLRFIQADRRSRTKILPEDTRLSISHVAHHWRTVALESPELWSEIHVRDTTKVEYLALARNNSKMQPLYVEGYNINLTGAAGVRYVLQTEPHRINGVTLHAPIEVMRSLLPYLKRCCEAIEFLYLELPRRVQTPLDSTDHDIFFNIPKLRNLGICYWDTLLIPTSFQPSSLVKLELYFTRSPSAQVTRSAFAALRAIASTLKNLFLSFLSRSSSPDFWNNFDRSPIDMPSLEVAFLVARTPGVLPELVSLIRPPSSFSEVYIAGEGSAATPDEYHAIVSALQRTYSSIYSPNFLRVRRPVQAAADSNAIEVIADLKPTHKNIQTNSTTNSIRTVIIPSSNSSLPISSPGSHPLPIPFPNSSDWLFGSQRVIVLEVDLPVAFWRAFSRIPTLSTIYYCAKRAEDGFLQALEEIVANEGPFKGDETYFPSLHTVYPIFSEEDIAWDIEYARSLAILLGKAWAKSSASGSLTLLQFVGCSSESLDKETVCILRSVVRGVLAWNDQEWNCREPSEGDAIDIAPEDTT